MASSINTNTSGFKLEEHKELSQVTTKQNVALDIMDWGRDNSFPQTIKNIVAQSPNAASAVLRTSKFYRGGAFKGEDIIINPAGLTLGDLASKMADDLALIEGYSIQCDYNMKGLINGINPIDVETCRFNTFDEYGFSSKIAYHRDFGDNSPVEMSVMNSITKSQIKFIDRFAPKYALDQIKALKEEGGISRYNGQILYHSGAGHSKYPVPPLQSAINYVLSDVENSILVRKETATGFISTYILKSTLDYNDPNLIALENSIIEVQGARGMGKIITVSGLTEDETGNDLLEEIGGGANSAIIESATKTYDLDKSVINHVYLIPPVLGGQEAKTGFSTESLKDAYFVFNTITEDGRVQIQKDINKILKNGDFGIDSIELCKLKLDIEQDGEEVEIAPDEAMVADNTTLTNLSGRQLQGIQRIVRKFNKDDLSYDQAAQLLRGGFGFTEDEIAEWLVTEEEALADDVKEEGSETTDKIVQDV
jgi:hypothetical protein